MHYLKISPFIEKVIAINKSFEEVRTWGTPGLPDLVNMKGFADPILFLHFLFGLKHFFFSDRSFSIGWSCLLCSHKVTSCTTHKLVRGDNVKTDEDNQE